MRPNLSSLVLGFVALAVIFGIIERRGPRTVLRQTRSRSFRTDLIYWFFTPLVAKTVSRISLGLALMALLPMVGRHFDVAELMHGYGPVARLPIWVQAVLVIALGDLIGYWNHRLFHGRSLWKFHAVHHSTEDLNWLSSVRVHPINDAVGKVVEAVPMVLIGFQPAVVAAYIPLLTFYSIFVHADVSWDFGPLRYVIATPAFHRWHHSRRAAAIDKNFAGLLPLWDLLFGTFYLPRGQCPQDFGVKGGGVPDGFLGQLLYPFRRTRPSIPEGNHFDGC